jgi:hypothetical protein
MSKPSFTSGPWKFESANGWFHIRDATGNSLQCDESYYPWVSTNIADWHLIAAAPEMYAALQELLAWSEPATAEKMRSRSGTLGQAEHGARAALYKARGEVIDAR